jgi:cardiolipin synthase A/B
MPCSLSVPLQDLEQDIRFYFSLCTQESELYMLNMRERTGVLFKRFSTLSLLRLVRKAILGLLTLQALTAAVLLVIAALGKRRKHEVSFPHDPFEEVQVGENVLRLYAYGRDLYDAMLEAIDAAQESIYLETYIWKDDAVGQEFRMHLARKAAEGVAVYVIFDRFGNLVVPRAFKSSFAPPIHVLEYSAIRHPWHLLDPRRYALDHRKLLIVDGTTSFIGGYNIGSTYATEWRDTHLGLRGPVAAELAMSFIAFWNRFCPAHERITHRYHRSVDSRIVAGQNEAMRLSFPIRDLYIAAIDQAEQFIFLTTAYFVPDRMLLEALQAAARRGVDVRVLIPWVSNHVLADWVAHSYFTDCLQGGVRIFGYRYTMLHAKTCTIDGQWSTVGTCNLDRLSLVGNYEINVAVYSAEFAQHMSALFAEDTAEKFELTMEQWKRRPWYNKVSERILAPLRFMM